MRVSTVLIAMFTTMAASVLFDSGEQLPAAILQIQDVTTDNANTNDVMTGVSKWEIDNTHTSVVCAVSHFGLSYIYGRFNECSGSIELDLQDSSATKFRFEVNPESIDTNNVARDTGLRGKKGFDVDVYDSIVFESIDVKAKDEEHPSGKTKRTFLVVGNLTMHGETRKIEMPLELLAMGKGADGNLRCGFISRFIVRRSDFGLDAMADSVGDSVAITFCFQALRKNVETEIEVIDSNLSQGGDSGSDSDSNDNKRSEIEELFRKSPSANEKESESPSGK